MKKPRTPDSIRIADKFPLFKPNAQSIARRRPVHGIGVNDADYITRPTIDGKKLHCPIHQKWQSMLARCYDPKCHAKQPTYIGCTVATEWLTFSNFHDWMTEQEWVGKALDKDILIIGNKIYSPENCLFVSQAVNGLLNDQTAQRGAYPAGVSYFKRDRNYVAHIRIDGKSKNLGYCQTQEQASAVYRAAKKLNIERLANKQTCQKTKTGLLRHAALLA